MARIPIIADQKKPSVPTAKQLSTEQARYRPSGKPALTLSSSYSPQAKAQRENTGGVRTAVKVKKGYQG
jgi:hypothetical protein